MFDIVHNLMSYHVLIRGAALSTKPLVLNNIALIVKCHQKIMVFPSSPILVRCNPKMFLSLRPTTVKCLYINHILNNFVLINFDVSMAENVIDDHPRPEEQVNRPETIPMVPTRGPSK
jgi:hypothetical protein